MWHGCRYRVGADVIEGVNVSVRVSVGVSINVEVGVGVGGTRQYSSFL